MLKLINTKILLAILAALVAIGSAAIYQSHEANKKKHNSTAAHEGKTWQKYIP